MITNLVESALRDLAHQAATSPLNDLKQPSDRQKSAGNYKKGKCCVCGFNISVENPQGSIRCGVDPDGVEWKQTMHSHYGYIRGTYGADGGHLDCFLGVDAENENCPVYVINQINPKTGEFDEHKIMIGFHDQESARRGYLANYSPGWKGLGEIHEITLDQLKSWIRTSDTTQPYA